MYLYTKKNPAEAGFKTFYCFYLQVLGEDIVNAEDSVVLVRSNSSQTIRSSSPTKWVCCHAVTSLEPDAWLEVILANRTYHLERYVWAVEHTSIIRIGAFVTNSYIVSNRIWVDEDLSATIQYTSKRVACVIYVQRSRQSRCIVKHTSSSQSSSNV